MLVAVILLLFNLVYKKELDEDVLSLNGVP